MRELIITAFLWGALLPGKAAPFEYEVYQVKHLRRDQPGHLVINDAGISYRSNDVKSKFSLMFRDIKTADLSEGSLIRIEMYDRTKWRLGHEKMLIFRLREGVHGEDLAQFLSAHLSRPVIGAYEVTSEKSF